MLSCSPQNSPFEWRDWSVSEAIAPRGANGLPADILMIRSAASMIYFLHARALERNCTSSDDDFIALRTR
jgi:hypothetical protein